MNDFTTAASSAIKNKENFRSYLLEQKIRNFFKKYKEDLSTTRFKSLNDRHYSLFGDLTSFNQINKKKL